MYVNDTVQRPRRNLLATLTVVALHDRLGVKPLFLEAGLPLFALVLHHQVLHAVDETEMHILQPATDRYHIVEFSRLG
jgi:hypothetical protein